MKLQKAAIAANRFGLGAKPNQLNQVSDAPQEWLLDQLKPPRFDDKLGDFNESLALFQTRNTMRKAAAEASSKASSNDASSMSSKMRDTRKLFQQQIIQLYAAPLVQSIQTNDTLSWRLLDFFSNHFSVSGDSGILKTLAPYLERDAIAPHLLGQFEDMLISVIQHPAMLIYLNNENSFGEDSKMAQRKARQKKASQLGINENLAREILELHTLGVNGGYTQADVNELAHAITGWSVRKKQNDKTEAGYYFRNAGHQPGKRTVLGKKYAVGMEEQGEAILRDLAKHPSTASFVCYKLARHFISDKPYKALVDAMQKQWLKTDGNILSVVKTMIQHPKSWQAEKQKFKTPRELIVSTYRALGQRPKNVRPILNALESLGQQPFAAGSPAGYGDTAEHWNGGSALVNRMEWANAAAERSRFDPMQVIEHALGDTIHQNSLLTIQRAESRQQALALLFMSPDFQYR